MKKVGDIEVAETMTIIELNEMALIYIKCHVRCLEKTLIVSIIFNAKVNSWKIRNNIPVCNASL